MEVSLVAGTAAGLARNGGGGEEKNPQYANTPDVDCGIAGVRNNLRPYCMLRDVKVTRPKNMVR